MVALLFQTLIKTALQSSVNLKKENGQSLPAAQNANPSRAPADIFQLSIRTRKTHLKMANVTYFDTSLCIYSGILPAASTAQCFSH